MISFIRMASCSRDSHNNPVGIRPFKWENLRTSKRAVRQTPKITGLESYLGFGSVEPPLPSPTASPNFITLT